MRKQNTATETETENGTKICVATSLTWL